MSSHSYSRVSNNSSLKGMSLSYQLQGTARYRDENDLPGWALSHGSQGLGRFEDRAVSAWKVPLAKRPDGAVLCHEVRDGDDVIFYSLCRGFRSVSDWANTFEAWTKRGITMHFVMQRLNMGSALGKFMGNLLAAIAQFKCDMISERARMQRIGKGQRDDLRVPNYGATKQMVKPEIITDSCEPLARMERAMKQIQAEQKRAAMVMYPGKVYRYVRCSHAEQVENGNTLPDQTRKTGLTATRILEENPGLQEGMLFVDEAVSAWKLNFRERPSGRLLCGLLRRGDHVVIAKMDRAFRSVWDFVTQMQAWEEEGVTVHFHDSGVCTSDPMGRLMVTVAAALAQFESEMISATTAEGIAAIRAQGGVGGRAPRCLKWQTSRRGGSTHRQLVMDYDYIAEVEWVEETRDELRRRGWSFSKIQDEIERLIAEAEGKKMVPASGLYVFDESDYAGQVVIARRGGRRRLVRRWGDHTIRGIHNEARYCRSIRAAFEGEGDLDELSRDLAEAKLARRGKS